MEITNFLHFIDPARDPLAELMVSAALSVPRFLVKRTGAVVWAVKAVALSRLWIRGITSAARRRREMWLGHLLFRGDDRGIPGPVTVRVGECSRQTPSTLVGPAEN